MRRLRTYALAVLALVIAAGTAWAMTRQYSSGINGLSATATSKYQVFTDNHSGGNTAAFGALGISVRSRGTGVCFVNPGELTATTGDHRIASGEVITIDYDTQRDRNGFAGIAYICTTAQTATLDVSAWR